MVTDAHEPLLNRDVSKATAAGMIATANIVLIEVVNYGTNLFGRANQAADAAYARLADADPDLPADPIGDFHLPIMLLALHSLEMTDATQVLLNESVVTPAELQVRALFEAVAQLEYLLERNTARRAFAYQVFDMQKRLRFYRSMIPASQEGRHLGALLAKDKWVGSVPIPPFGDPESAINHLEPLLKTPGYREATAEYERMKVGGHRPRNWFAMYDGPRNIEALATHVGRAAQYELLYRQWSVSAHGEQVGQRVTRSGGIRAMRQASNLITLLELTITLCLSAIELLGNFYRPGEEVARATWYFQNVKPHLDRWTNSAE